MSTRTRGGGGIAGLDACKKRKKMSEDCTTLDIHSAEEAVRRYSSKLLATTGKGGGVDSIPHTRGGWQRIESGGCQNHSPFTGDRRQSVGGTEEASLLGTIYIKKNLEHKEHS